MLLLASASPARRRLLEQACIPHRVRVSGVDEDAIRDSDPLRLVQRLAQAKAEAVVEALSPSLMTWGSLLEEPGDTSAGPAPLASVFAKGATTTESGSVAARSSDWQDCDAVLGCDSLLVFEGEVFGKPADAAEAVARWQRMSGGRAELHTGHCLLRPGRELLLETVTTGVVFAAVDTTTIAAYVATGEPLACAGGFALEGRGSLLVERIEGCCSNVIGLSMPLLRRWLGGFPGS
jgi:septum formation protein